MTTTTTTTTTANMRIGDSHCDLWPNECSRWVDCLVLPCLALSCLACQANGTGKDCTSNDKQSNGMKKRVIVGNEEAKGGSRIPAGGLDKDTRKRVNNKTKQNKTMQRTAPHRTMCRAQTRSARLPICFLCFVFCFFFFWLWLMLFFWCTMAENVERQ